MRDDVSMVARSIGWCESLGALGVNHDGMGSPASQGRTGGRWWRWVVRVGSRARLEKRFVEAKTVMTKTSSRGGMMGAEGGAGAGASPGIPAQFLY